MKPPPLKPHPRPQPGLPRTIGWLNILLGLALLGCGCVWLYLLAPVLLEDSPLRVDPKTTHDVLESMRHDAVTNLQWQENHASSDAERQRLKKAGLELRSASTDLAGKVDFGAINRDLPWLARYLWADSLTGPPLNLGMLAAGIGLISLRGWGRRLAIGVATLKIIRLIGLGAMLFLVVIPRMNAAAGQIARAEISERLFEHAMDQQNSRRAAAGVAESPRLNPADFLKILRAMIYGSAAMSFGAALIYPVISLVVLTRPVARLACAAARGGETVNGATDPRA